MTDQNQSTSNTTCYSESSHSSIPYSGLDIERAKQCLEAWKEADGLMELNDFTDGLILYGYDEEDIRTIYQRKRSITPIFAKEITCAIKNRLSETSQGGSKWNTDQRVVTELVRFGKNA